MYQLPLNPAIAHLTQKELDELMAAYSEGIKASILIAEFKINAHVSQIRKILPATLLGQTCSICGADKIREVPSRSARVVTLGKERCTFCTHEDNISCRCPVCVRERCQRAAEERARLHDQVVRTIVAAQPKNPVVIDSLSDLSLESAVALLAFIRCCPVDARGVFAPVINSPVAYTPTVTLTNELLATLCQSHFIAVSEYTSEKEVEIDGDRLLYDPQRARWMMSVVDRNNLVESIEVAGLTGEWPAGWQNQIKPLWLKIALAECRQFYDYQAELRGLHVRGDVALNEMLNNLLRDFSVGQVYWAIWRGAQQTADFLVRKGPYKAHAANYMIGACQRNADHARVSGWAVPPFRRNFDLPRSMVSYVMFDVLLKIGERGFSEPIRTMGATVESADVD